MSVLLEFAMFPTDKGESVSPFVARIERVINAHPFPHQLTAMGTLVETQRMEEALALIDECYRALHTDCNRVYCTANIDIRKDVENRLRGKVLSVEEKL
ncbi:MAG: MTH1187 family thiamine-binding protein [Bacteroidales bacterium]|nr:MTH1187 family thiamine-binding protein [Bacteroidales bacterium]